MSSRPSPRVAGPVAALVAVLAALAVLGGCSIGDDDEMVRDPEATPTTPAPSTAVAAPLPATVPVGGAHLDPARPVWAQGSQLHVGVDTVDVSPRRVDAFVATPGGLYFLDDGEVWLTDLSVVRATGLTGVTALAVDATRHHLLVTATGADGGSARQGYDTATGASVPARSVRVVTSEQRLGRPDTLRLRTERSDVSPTAGPVPVRMGAGRFGLVDDDGGPLVAFDTTYDLRRPLTGVVGDGFELVTWTGPATFYGLALQDGRPRAVLGCDVAAGSCRTWGRADRGGSLLFEPGS